MKGLLPPLLATIALIVAAACADPEEETLELAPTTTATTGSLPKTPVASPNDAPSATPAADATLWRWGEVTLLVPDESGVRVTRNNSGDSPTGGPSIYLVRGDSEVRIDAKTGEVFSSQLQDTDQSDFEVALESIRLAKPDDALPWPYAAQEPIGQKVQQLDLLYWDPIPAAGLIVGFLIRDGVSGGDEVIYIENIRSRRLIDAHTGEVLRNNDRIAPEDAEAFDRWTAAIEAGVP